MSIPGVMDIKAFRDEAEGAAKSAQKTKEEIESIEAKFRTMSRGFVDALFIDLSTRRIIPPPQLVLGEIQKHLNIINKFAYPDPIERTKHANELKAFVEKVREGKKGAK